MNKKISFLMMMLGVMSGLSAWGFSNPFSNPLSGTQEAAQKSKKVGSGVADLMAGGMTGMFKGMMMLNQVQHNAKSAMDMANNQMNDMKEMGTNAMEMGREEAALARQSLDEAKENALAEADRTRALASQEAEATRETVRSEGQRARETADNAVQVARQEAESTRSVARSTVDDAVARTEAQLEAARADANSQYEASVQALEDKYAEMEAEGEGEGADLWDRFEEEMAQLEADRDRALRAVEDGASNVSTAASETQEAVSAELERQRAENERLRQQLAQQANDTSMHVESTLDENALLLQRQLAEQAAENEKLRQQLAGAQRVAVDDVTAQARAAIDETKEDIGEATDQGTLLLQQELAEQRKQNELMRRQFELLQARGSSAIDNANTAVDAASAQTSEAITDASQRTSSAVDAASVQTATAIANVHATAESAVDDAHTQALGALDKAASQWVTSMVRVGDSSSQLGYHLQKFEPGQELRTHLKSVEGVALTQARQQLVDELSDLEVARDQAIEMHKDLTGFAYDEYITRRDEAIETMVAPDLTGHAREVALQVATFEYQYDGTVLTPEQIAIVNSVNADYAKQSLAARQIFALTLQSTTQSCVARLGDGIAAFQSTYNSMVTEVQGVADQTAEQIAAAQAQADAMAAQAEDAAAELAETQAQLALLNAQAPVRLALGKYQMSAQLIVNNISVMTREQLESADFRIAHNKEVAAKKDEMTNLYQQLVAVELGPKTSEVDSLRAAFASISEARSKRLAALEKQELAEPVVTVSLGKKKG